MADNETAPLPAPESAGIPAVPPPRRGRGLLWFVVLVLLAACAAAGWIGMQYHAAVEALAARVGAIDTQVQSLAGLGDRVAADDAAIEAVRAQLRAQQDAQRAQGEALRRELQEGLARATAPRDAPAQDLALEEAQYLVFAAGQRLALERDVATAITLLQAADQRLTGIEDPDLFAVRGQFASDIEALRAAPQPDVEGLALALADAAARAGQLPLRVLSQPASPLAAIGAREYGNEGWRGVLAQIWRDLLGLVEVRDAQPADTEILDAPRQRLLIDRLRLELAAARSAVLLRDAANLRACAQVITSLLDEYFDAAAPAVQQLRARLAEAAMLDLSPALPGVGASLDALRAYRATAALRPTSVPEVESP